MSGRDFFRISEMAGGASAPSPRPATAAFQPRVQSRRITPEAHSKPITAKTFSQNLIREAFQRAKVVSDSFKIIIM